MERKYYSVFGIVILIIIGIILIIYAQQLQQLGPGMGGFNYVEGFLFSVDGQKYLVRDPAFTYVRPHLVGEGVVITEQKLKEFTDLEDIVMPAISIPPISSEEAKNAAGEELLKKIEELRLDYEGFDLQDCINKCESPAGGELPPVGITCDEFCQNEQEKLRTRYLGLEGTQIGTPRLIYSSSGEPLAYVVPALNNSQTYIQYTISEVTAEVGNVMYLYYEGVAVYLPEWFTEEKAREILGERVSGTISDGIFVRFYEHEGLPSVIPPEQP